MDSSQNIVLVCAMKHEFAAVEAGLGSGYSQRFELIRAGVGPKAASRIGVEISARTLPPHLIVSTGFCGALVAELKVGDIVLSAEISDAGSKTTAVTQFGRNLIERLARRLSQDKIRAHCGATVSTAQAVFKVADKRQLGENCNAIAVDMESSALSRSMDQARTAVVVIRAVSDAVTDELPSEVAEFLDENGGVRIGRIVRFVLKNPANIARLSELKKHSDLAGRSLSAAWHAIKDQF